MRDLRWRTTYCISKKQLQAIRKRLEQLMEARRKLRERLGIENDK